MTDMLRPKNLTELSDVIKAGSPLSVQGLGTKSGLGRPVQGQPVSLAAFKGVIAYEPEELILDVGTATPMADIVKLLRSKKQHLAFEPPDYSQLLGSQHAGSIGGIIACNLSGPRRLSAGAARDHVMGFQAVSGRGEIFKAGARVVKNVTGYDLPKLMANSYGTLAVMTSLILKVLPAPETEETLVVEDLDVDLAVEVMSQAMQSSAEICGAAYMNRNVLLRLEGIPASIAYRLEKLSQLLKQLPRSVLAGAQSQAEWSKVRNVLPLADNLERDVWKISTTPSEAPAFVAAVVSKTNARYFLDWAGGLIWLDLPQSFDCGSTLVRGNLKSGHAILVRAPADKRKMVPVFHPQKAGLAALTMRVKSSFDPQSVLNPGRMYEGC